VESDIPDQNSKNLFSLSDPNVAQSIIDDLKSHGILDEARKACIAEVDSKVKKVFLYFSHVFTNF